MIILNKFNEEEKNNMEFKNYEELLKEIKNDKNKKKVAIASAADEHTIEAALDAFDNNISMPIFIGNKNNIQKILTNFNREYDQFEIINEKDILKTPYIASGLVNEGNADFVMKGLIDTSDFLRGIVDKETGLRTGNVMSHIAFLQIPNYPKLVAVTDGGMIINPDLSQKRQILQNAFKTLLNMGYDNPKAAAFTAVEKPNKSMQETIDAQKLHEESESGEFINCVLEGPVSYDVAISKKSALVKGFEGRYCGGYDIWLVPNISAGNLLCKALIYNAGAKMAGIVVGAKVPLVLNSRSSSSEEKYYAMALAAASSKGF